MHIRLNTETYKKLKNICQKYDVSQREVFSKAIRKNKRLNPAINFEKKELHNELKHKLNVNIDNVNEKNADELRCILDWFLDIKRAEPKKKLNDFHFGMLKGKDYFIEGEIWNE